MYREPPEDGLMCEMLWSDPKPTDGRGPSQRGVGVGFGPDVTRNFLQDNKLDLLVRSHEVTFLDCVIGFGCHTFQLKYEIRLLGHFHLLSYIRYIA